jgi:hypothetical protein
MKKGLAASLLTVMLSSTAFASFNLARNGKPVVCYGEDNQSWNLNAKRTTLKFTVEGESSGPKRITKVFSDGSTLVSYTTSEGTLYLSNRGDAFQFKGEEKQTIRCK